MRHKFFSAIVILAIFFSLPFQAAASSGQQDLDIIFVIDCSGSMLRADPGKLALAGPNMFIDYNKDNDLRVGYVMYTHEIVADLQLTNIKPIDQNDPIRQLLKNSISANQYQSNGDTDTALALERAYELLKEDPSHRKQAIILLSDGNIDLPKGPRTTEQSVAALESIKSVLENENIPVYTIGLNYDGKLDAGTMADIADKTGGMAQEVKTSDQLSAAILNIYSEMGNQRSGSVSFPATGELQTYDFPIEDSSVYKATVSISGSEPITEGYMIGPDNKRYDETDTSGTLTIDRDQSGRYLLMSLYSPMQGTWQLNFVGTKGDTVSIDMFYLYDLTLVMDNPVTEYGKATISWQLQDNEGNKVSDKALIDSVSVTLYIEGGSPYDFPAGQQSQTFEMEPGQYTAHLEMVKEGLEKKESNSCVFTVPDAPPPTLKDPTSDTIVVSLTTLFDTEEEFYIDDYVAYEKFNSPLTVSFDGGDWEDRLELEYDPSGGIIHVTALKSGNAEVTVTVTGAEGSGVDVILYIDAKIKSGWLYIIIACGVLLLIAGVVLLLLLNSKPYLDTPIREIPIQVNLPDNQIENTPPEAFLRLEHVKAKRTLREVIQYNREHSSQYNIAFENIGWFTNGMVFRAKRPDELEVIVPANNLYVTRVDNKNQTGIYTARLTRNSKLSIELARKEDSDEVYQIILGSGASPGTEWDDGDDPFAVTPKSGGLDSGFDGFDF